MHELFALDLDKNDSRRFSLKVSQLGDLAFFLGAFLDVVFSYISLVHKNNISTASETETSAGFEIISSMVGVVAAVISTTMACRLGKGGFSGEASASTVAPLQPNRTGVDA